MDALYDTISPYLELEKNVIIDADCHISSAHHDSLAITAGELVAQLDREGVDRGLVWLKPRYDKAVDPENRAIYEASKQYPDRLIPFGWANPHHGRDATLATIKQCFEEFGFYGIKFNGAQDGYVIDDESFALPYIEAAARYGKMIAFHIGSDFFENTHPYRLGSIAARFPEIQFFMIHMGGAAVPHLARSAIETAAKYDNIHIIGSAIPFKAILEAIHTLGADRVCYGSDLPFKHMPAILAGYKATIRDLSQSDQNNIMGGNVARLVGLE